MSTDTDNFNTDDLTPDIEKLKLSDTFYTWFLTTNKIIDYVNPIQIYDLLTGSGFTRSELNGEVTIDLNIGKGIKLYPDVGNGDITIDLASIFSAETTVRDSDYVLFERSSTENTNLIFSVEASDMLPPTINDDHEFMGTITTSGFNLRSQVITLAYGASITGISGFRVLDNVVPANSFYREFGYDTTKQSWSVDSNILLKKEYSFVSNNTGSDAHFRFSTTGSQRNVTLEFAVGLESTSADDTSWKIQARKYLNRLDFIYGSTEITDLERTVFYARMDNVYTNSSTFVITDKIEIGNVGGSTNFAQTPDYTQYKIPITNSTGILDSKWTNRYVTSDYVSLSVGDLVKIFDNTNNDTYITRCDLSSSSTVESDTYTFGIVERISGGKAYIAMLGEFNLQTTPSPALEPGLTYYLTTGSPNFTKTKPTTGLIKPVFIATGSASGVIFPMASSALSFGKVSVSTSESGYIIGSGETVYSNASNGDFILTAGSGITLETDPNTREVIIRSTSGSNSPGYSTILGDTGVTLQAITPTDTLTITGGGGGIEVETDNNTSNDIISIRGKYFRHIEITGDETDDETGTVTATNFDDTLTFYAGAGIRLTNPAGNILRLEAVGDAVASIPNYSLMLSQLQKQPKNSILYSEGSTTETLTAVKALQATDRSMLMYSGSQYMTWETPLSFFATDIAEKQASGTITQSSKRILGISVHEPGVSTPIGSANGVACFVYDDSIKPNSVDNIRLGFIEGDGIQLEVINSYSDASWVGVPAIKISNTDATSKFRNVVITNTNETIVADSNGVLKLTSPSGSPIYLDGDSNSDTVYFNIWANSITNAHLAEMPDNTVKVGIGDTNNTPSDLLISTNSVLGRLSGELQSLSSSDLKTILGLSSSDYFTTIITDNGTLYATDNEMVHISGGTGISTSVGTDNEIIITNSLPVTGDLGISTIGYKSHSSEFDMVTGVNKLYFAQVGLTSGIGGDLGYSFQKTGTKAYIQAEIGWATIGKPNAGTTNSRDDGSGLLYGKKQTTAGRHFKTEFSQIGNGVGGWRIPYFDSSDNALKYFGMEDATLPDGTPHLDKLIGFAANGGLVKTNAYVGTITTSITGLNITNDTFVTEYILGKDDANILTFKQYKAEKGNYWGNTSAFVLEPTTGRDFILLTSQATTAFTKLSSIKFGSSLTSTTVGGVPDVSYTSITSTDISVKTFTSNWYQLGASGTPTNIICMPERIMLGVGPTSGSSESSTGYVIRNNSTDGSLVLTNYNLNAVGNRSTEKDRSAKLKLEVMNVDSPTSNAYASLKSSGSIVHTYTNVTSSANLVDEFTVGASGSKSVKYLIQAISNSTPPKTFTTEFIVQANADSNYCNYIQYASVTEPAGFSLDISATMASTGGNDVVTVSSNATTAIPGGLSTMKVMKIEI